jgi:hypothetical protein
VAELALARVSRRAAVLPAKSFGESSKVPSEIESESKVSSQMNESDVLGGLVFKSKVCEDECDLKDVSVLLDDFHLEEPSDFIGLPSEPCFEESMEKEVTYDECESAILAKAATSSEGECESDSTSDSESESEVTLKADEKGHVADIAAGVGFLAAPSAVPAVAKAALCMAAASTGLTAVSLVQLAAKQQSFAGLAGVAGCNVGDMEADHVFSERGLAALKASGDETSRLCREALLAAGYPPAAARRPKRPKQFG